MNWLAGNMTGCLDTIVSSCRQWLPELVAEEVVLGTRRFRIVRLLGEVLATTCAAPKNRSNACTLYWSGVCLD